MQDDGN